MTARGFDYFDAMAVAAAPPPRMVQPTAPSPATTPTARRDATRLLRGSAYLLALAGIHLLLAFVVAATALHAIDADVGVVYVAALLTALIAVVWGGWRA